MSLSASIAKAAVAAAWVMCLGNKVVDTVLRIWSIELGLICALCCALPHPIARLLTHSFSHSLAHSLTHSLTHPLTHSRQGEINLLGSRRGRARCQDPGSCA